VKKVDNTSNSMNNGITYQAALEMDGAMWLLDTETTIINRYDRGFLSVQPFETGFPTDMGVIRWFFGYNSIFVAMEDPSATYDGTTGWTNTGACNVHWTDMTAGSSGEYVNGTLEGTYEKAYILTESSVLLLPSASSMDGAKVFDLLSHELTDFTGKFDGKADGKTISSMAFDAKNKCYWAVDEEMNIYKAAEGLDFAWEVVYSFPAAGNPLTDPLRQPVQELFVEASGIRLASVLEDGNVLTIQIPKALLGL